MSCTLRHLLSSRTISNAEEGWPWSVSWYRSVSITLSDVYYQGIITTGSAVGGFFFSIVLGQFLDGPIGFAWGVRICAFICLAFLIVANGLMRTNYPPRAPSTLPAKTNKPLSSLIRSPAYVFMIAFGLVISLALYNPMFSVQLFAGEQDDISENLTKYLLAIINLTSTLGRTIPNFLADRYGVFPVYIPCVAAAGRTCSMTPFR